MASARAPFDRRVLLAWALARLVVLALTFGWFKGDTETYFAHGHAFWAGAVPYRDHAIEYPPGAALLFTTLAAVGSYARFRPLFVLATLLVDFLVVRALVRAHERATSADRRTVFANVFAYLAATTLLYPILLVRFDLYPSLAVALAVLALMRAQEAPQSLRPAVAAGLFLGAGVALKLYPLLYFPFLFLAVFRGVVTARQFLVVAAVSAAVVAGSFAAFLAAGAGGAVLSFLGYQGGRGIQIESTWAALLLLLRTIGLVDVHHQASHHAHDVAGPAADVLARVARVAQPLAVLGVSVLAHVRRLGIAQSFAAITATALATSAVFSPQFLLWLLPLAFLALAAGAGTARPWSWVALAGLTTLVFPLMYQRLIALAPDAALVLGARNALLVTAALLLLAPGRAPTPALQGAALGPQSST